MSTVRPFECEDGAFAVFFPVASAKAAEFGHWLIVALPKAGTTKGEPDYEVVLVKDWAGLLPAKPASLAQAAEEVRKGGAGLFTPAKAPLVAANTERQGQELRVHYGPMSGPACTWGTQGDEAMRVIGAIQEVEAYLVGKFSNVTHKVCQANSKAPARR
ncbi:hypothetical protein E3E12_04390 [Formicincola oecophyllae]|uniref:Uncharacterized protein n=1 Tax=Formicincola oecophyllae TaxID=2558361 RepID=A0A4Y6U803_9PROT|nr:hypothetical protein [Formicincola oecophyllae]QDH13559.1 hypothetical protein E3E12_04390 [Formicincola oecophyllae]